MRWPLEAAAPWSHVYYNLGFCLFLALHPRSPSPQPSSCGTRRYIYEPGGFADEVLIECESGIGV